MSPPSAFPLWPSRLVRTLAVLTTVALCLSGCGKPFNVKPRTELPRANYTATASLNSVTLQADPIFNEDLLYETFDANLIMAGVLPVRVRLTNSSQQSLVLKKSRFEIRSAGGRKFKSASGRNAFKRVLSYYGISTYNKAGYKESLEDFAGYAFDAKAPLPAQESREGIVFFFVPPEASREAGLTLRFRMPDGKAAPIELKLN